MKRPVRVGAVNYLNTKPLIYNLETLAPQAKLSLDLPSRLADQMARNELDVGLIPVIEYFRARDYLFVPNISIASRGPVLSVTVFSKVPWPKIRSIALDEGSRTSAALTLTLMQHRYGIRPAIQPLPIADEPESADTDAILLIGDRAMRACLPGYRYAFDLGEEWTSWTGLPFVFALWAVRPGVDLAGVDDALTESKRQGLAAVGEIAARESAALGLGAGYCRRYLTNIIHFDLGPRELAGLRRFYELACECGLAPAGVSLECYDSRNLVESR